MPFTGGPHLGREAELERLQRALDDTRSGHGRLVVVRGPMGTGTTRFAHEVAARADRAGMIVLWGRCSEGLTGRPYGGLAEALEEYAAGLEPRTLALQLDAGAAPLARLAPRVRAVVPRIPPPAPLDASDEQLRLQEAVLGWLERASTHTPLCLVLDDAQWADPDLVELLARLAVRAPYMPLLVVATYAEAAGDTQPVPDGAEVVDLPGLDVAAIETLLTRDMGLPAAQALVEAVADVSAGVPVHVRQLCRHLVEENLLPPPGDRRATLAATLPASFEELLAWRASRLSAETRTVVNALACLPDGGSTDLLAGVCGLSRARTAEALEAAVEHGLARAVGGAEHHALEHDRVRLAVLSAIPASRRAELHQRIADALEEQHGELAREHAGELAHHHHRARQLADPGRGIRHCLVAAEQSRAAGAYRRSAQALTMANDLVPPADRALRAELLSRLGTAQAEAGLATDSIASLGAALDAAARTPARLAETLAAVADGLEILHALAEDRAAEAPAALEDVRRRALALAARADEHTRARIDSLGGGWQPLEVGAVRALQWTGSTSRWERSTPTDRDHADESLLAVPAIRTRDDTLRLLSIVRSSRRPPTVLGSLRASVLDMLTRHGLFREALSWSSHYLAAADRYGSIRHRICALALLARAQAVLGHLDDADAAADAARSALGRLEPEGELERECLLSELVIAHYRDGDWSSVARRTTHERPVPQGLALAAERSLAQARAGLEPEAVATLRDVLEAVAHQPPLTFYRDAALLTALTVAWELGRAEHSARGVTLIEVARAGGVGTQPAASLGLAQARMLGLSSDVEGARSLFEQERTYLDTAGLAPLRAILEHDEAIAVAASGPAEYGSATSLLEGAARRFRELGMTGWLKRVETLLGHGLEAATQPGGRLYFRYPAGLSRREADIVRWMLDGGTVVEAAAALDMEPTAAERHLSSGLAKLGADTVADLPRLARQHGLAGSR